jgi:cob(I)alamin adenosyltransferase
MSIATRTGDEGTTGLMFNRRVLKTDPQVEASGNIDELNASLGMCRSTTDNRWVKEQILLLQKELIAFMGELSVLPEDQERYKNAGYALLENSALDRVDATINDLEKKNLKMDGWATPGHSLHSASLDLARTICRRAERFLLKLHYEKTPVRPLLLKYLNRVSDLLWLFARLDESNS